MDTREKSICGMFLTGLSFALLLLPGCGSGSDGVALRTMAMDQAGGQARLMATLLQQVVNRRTVMGPASACMAGLREGERIGTIEIPGIGVKEWIVQGTSEESLKLGAGHIIQTLMPGMGGNFTVAGDRVLYSAPFLRVNELEPGDEIIVHLPYGDFVYLVESVRQTSSEDVSVTYPKEYETITLSTCDPPWGLSGRLTVSARLAATFPKAG